MKTALLATPPLHGYFLGHIPITVDVILGLAFALDHSEVFLADNLKIISMRKTLLTAYSTT
jgi:hypothetical protein